MKRISLILLAGILIWAGQGQAKKASDQDEALYQPAPAAEDAVESDGLDAPEAATASATGGTQSLADLTMRVDEVVNRLQNANGEMARQFKKNKEQDKIVHDTQTRVQVLEDKILHLTGQLTELQAEGLLPKAPSARLNEYKEYAKGLEHMNAQQFEKAIAEFEKFKTAHPQSVFQSYAQYWIGEAYYMQADYPMAIKQYQVLLKANEQSAKAATALYRQGLAFYHLNSFEDAKAFFSKVIRTYPQSLEALQASAQIERIKNIETLRQQEETERKMVN